MTDAKAKEILCRRVSCHPNLPLLVAVHAGKHVAIPRLDLTDVVFWGFLSAILGARVLFMMLSWKTAVFTLTEICTLGAKDGGFSFHGGLLAGGIVGFWVARHQQLPIWRLADVLALGLAVAMFFMRIGCLFNGCDYGVATTMPWGIFLHGATRHPIQLYEGLGNLCLFPLLVVLNQKPTQAGQTFLLYMLCSGMIRLGVDFYREDAGRIWNLFTIPQLLAAAIAVCAGFGLYTYRGKKKGESYKLSLLC